MAKMAIITEKKPIPLRRSVRLLIVEDCQFALQSYQQNLPPERFQTLQIYNYRSAVLESEHLPNTDLILLDLNLPEKPNQRQDASGTFRLAEILQVKYPQLKIVIVSVEQNPNLIQRAKDAGLDGYLPKPTIGLPQQLPELLERILSGERIFLSDLIANSSEIKITSAEMNVVLTMRDHPDASRKKIALLMGLSHYTIKNHLNSVREKIGVVSDAGMMSKLIELGMLD
ncbi:MAG TPA: response regulator [Anaerolineales bacterium]|nr:response regulator [Anaerolineales bacterium]